MLIVRSTVRRRLRPPKAFGSVLTRQRRLCRSLDPPYTVTYDKQEFKQVSAQLNVLEAADARETEERDSLRFRIERKNGHRTRQNDVDESELSQPHKARVRHFVEEKQRFIEDQRIVSLLRRVASPDALLTAPRRFRNAKKSRKHWLRTTSVSRTNAWRMSGVSRDCRTGASQKAEGSDA